MSIIQVGLDFNKATILLNKGNFKRAIPIFNKVLKQYKFKEAYVNLGNAYRLARNYKKALETYLEGTKDNIPCYENDPQKTMGQLYNNLGLAYYAEGNDTEAQKIYTTALKSNPKLWEAWWNCSTSVLREASSGYIELFPKGWEMYDARFLKTPKVELKNNKQGLMYWDTVSDGDSIITLVEQGIGDSIMFGRYIPELAKKFKKVYVQCAPQLNDLFPGYECVTDAINCEANIAYPICSLAKCFNNGVPIAGDWLRGKFGTRSFPTSSKPNIGIVWAGSSSHVNNDNRSVPINRFHCLSDIANLYSLSPNFTSTKFVKSLDIKTWTDTAECINGLDLVISVDTSVIHLCGSLGRPGWVLQPFHETDFRWGWNVPKSVWYSSIRVIHNNGSWEDVFDRVKKDLNEKY